MDGDLISRKALLEILSAKSDMAIATPAQMIYANTARIVEMLPAVDAATRAEYEGLMMKYKRDIAEADKVQPVRHGGWRHLDGDEWCCTMCGEVIHTEGSWERPSDKYCRECGAKMDGEMKDDG